MPTQLGQRLHKRFAELKQEKGEDAAIDDITQSLEGELRGLAAYISQAKADIVGERPDEEAAQHIADAKFDLDAIIAHTEEATGAILDAAEELDGLADRLPADVAETVRNVTVKIYEASNFQDLTAQRIMRIAAALQGVEAKVASLLGLEELPTVEPSAKKEETKALEEFTDEDLLNGPQAAEDAISQDDIDALFDD